MRFLKLATVSVLTLLAVAECTGFAMAEDRGLRPAGRLTYEPEPVEDQRGTFRLRPEDRRVRALSIEVSSGAAQIQSLRINYDDGDSERVRVRSRLREGDRTDPVRIEGGRRVTSVEVVYAPAGAVTLTLLVGGRGGFDNSDGDQPPPPPPPAAEWVQLDCKSVGFVADRDTIPLNSPERFKALRLRSQSSQIQVDEMGVTYVDGARDVYNVRANIPGGGRTSPIELRGERRRIASIDLLYSSNMITNVKPKLCVDGLKARPGDF